MITLNSIYDVATSKEIVQQFGGQLLFWSSQIIQGHINWFLATVAAVIGLASVLQSYWNAKKKGVILDLEAKKLELETRHLELENRHLELENANLEKLKSN